MDKKFWMFFVIVILFNLLVLIVLWELGFLGYYVMVGIGIVLGLMVSEGAGNLRKLVLGLLSWTFLWVAGIMFLMLDELYGVKVWWFKKRYRIDEIAIKKYVEDLVIELCKKCEPIVDVKVGFFDELDKVILVVFIRDYDELVEKEKEIIENVSKKFGIPEDRIVIYWDDRWRYY